MSELIVFCRAHRGSARLTSYHDNTPMDPYQSLPFHILSYAYIPVQHSDEIAEEKKVFDRNMGISVQRFNMSKEISISQNELSSPIRSFLCPIPILACKQCIF